MSPLAWLIGFVFPACGFPAADGLPAAQPIDVAHIVRPSTPNTALAAPDGFAPRPDIATARYAVRPERLFALVGDVAASQKRVFTAGLYPAQLQAQYVARSAMFNFPDLIMVQVQPDGADGSGLIVYSRSVYGQSDLGVNRKRIVAWLAALQAKLPPSSER